jgi:hypothetical protein
VGAVARPIARMVAHPQSAPGARRIRLRAGSGGHCAESMVSGNLRRGRFRAQSIAAKEIEADRRWSAFAGSIFIVARKSFDVSVLGAR